MLGHRDNPYPYMARSRALLLSSDYEGFALVLAEALSWAFPSSAPTAHVARRKFLATA
ncbi:hypothetical protein A8U91_04332 [Halomonas elongata]|uniref:Glycosyl transferases group 1 n=1 Tax=Halomonas elongata TaxID=2746 RepID=A0A1B8NZ59_HALEL|nr:hypothetical protein A8U91_04332 [Halomonas elongata]